MLINIYVQVFIASNPHQNLALSMFQILAILVNVVGHSYSVILLFFKICISLIPYDMKYLFICVFAIFIYSLVRCPLRSLAYF